MAVSYGPKSRTGGRHRVGSMETAERVLRNLSRQGPGRWYPPETMELVRAPRRV